MYDAQVVRRHFEMWGHDEIEGEPGEPVSRWLVPYVNHMLIDRWLPAEGSALDAGCGRGIEAIRMARRGLSVTALDISFSLLGHARRRAAKAGILDRIAFVEADLTEKLPLPEGHFDICLALTGVLSHVGERYQEAASNIVTCCKPDGLIIVGVQSYLGKIRQYLLQGKIEEAQHVADTRFTHTVSAAFEDYCFTADELSDLFEHLGCYPEQMVSAPTVAADGYPADIPKSDFVHVLELEHRFLGTPELLGAGEQIVAVFSKSSMP